MEVLLAGISGAGGVVAGLVAAWVALRKAGISDSAQMRAELWARVRSLESSVKRLDKELMDCRAAHLEGRTAYASLYERFLGLSSLYEMVRRENERLLGEPE